MGYATAALKMFPRTADKALARYINAWAKHPLKTGAGTAGALGGSILAGGALASLFNPQIGKKLTSNLTYGLKANLQDAVSAGAQRFADTMTKQHIKRDKAGNPVIDPKTKKAIMQEGVIKRLSKAFSQHLSPALVKPVNQLSKAMGTVATKSGQIGKAFGQNLGTGFKGTGGKVLTGAGGAALGYTAADFTQVVYQAPWQVS